MLRGSRILILLLAAVLGTGSRALASSTSTLTVGPGDNRLSSGAWDSGTINISFIDSTGQTYSATVSYGQFSTPASVASAFGATFSNTYLPAGLCVYSNGSSIVFTRKGSATFGPPTITNSSTVNSFPIGLAGWQLVTPVITWAAPAPITYGTTLSASQLNATATFGGTSIPVPGVFSYSPAAGTVPSAGNRNLSVTFTPSNTSEFNTSTSSVSLTVNQATPVLLWSVPSMVPLSTVLNSTLLDATANVPGRFVYSPTSGTVLTGG